MQTGRAGIRQTRGTVRASSSSTCQGPDLRISSGPAVRCAAPTGRTYDCTRPPCTHVNKSLAKGERPHMTVPLPRKANFLNSSSMRLSPSGLIEDRLRNFDYRRRRTCFRRNSGCKPRGGVCHRHHAKAGDDRQLGPEPHVAALSRQERRCNIG